MAAVTVHSDFGVQANKICHCFHLFTFYLQWHDGTEKAGLKLNIQKTKIVASGPITSWQIDGEIVSDFIFWAPKSLQMVTAAMKLKDTYSWKKSYDQPR